MRRVRRAVGGALLGLLALAAPAAAADPPEAPAGITGAPAAQGLTCSRLRFSPPGGLDPLIESAASRLLGVAASRYHEGVASQDRWVLKRALDALELAFTLQPSPEFVLNMAQVQRHLGRCERARCLYVAYLDMPNSPEGRALATHHLAEMAECSDGVAAERSLGTWGLLRAVSLKQAMRGGGPVALSVARASGATVSRQRQLPRLLSIGAGLAVAWAAVDYAQAWKLDREVSHLPSDSPRLAALQKKGRAAQARAGLAGAGALALGVWAALGYWWGGPETPHPEAGPVRVGPKATLSPHSDLGMSLAVSF